MVKLTLCVLPLLAPVLNAQLLNIPEVDGLVSSMTAQFKQYVTYGGHPRATAAPRVQPAVVPTCPHPYWYENIKHQGRAAFNSNSSYVVYRNVRNYGAKGDGVTDDTAAINNAIKDGNRFGPNPGHSSTTTPAVVYLPAGTYLISSSLIDYYETQIVGNPNCMPVLKATPGFTGFGLIDGDQYQSTGQLGFGGTNVFYRQVRNIIFDLTAIPASSAATGIHWPTAQATSLQNLVFLMSDAPGTQHQGVFIESGSGGFVTDLVFKGGLYGMNQGNQQFTMRNISISNAVVGISSIWDWGWTYKGLTITNTTLAFNMSASGSGNQMNGAVMIIDSHITNCPVFVQTSWTRSSQPPSSGSLVLENVALNNVSVAVQELGGATILPGSTGASTIAAWAQGHEYNPTGPTVIQQNITPNPRPAVLIGNDGFYQQSKPQYQTLPVTAFTSARSQGAVGDGVTDDTAALQKAITTSVTTGGVLFIDAGTYKVTSTLKVPPGAKIVGESYSRIMGSGAYFSNVTSPKPVVQIGTAGQKGVVQWSDCLVTTQGGTAGAILIEWNLASPAGTPSGMWDVHTRIGGSDGSNQQVAQCPKMPSKVTNNKSQVNPNCVIAFMSMHITKSASGLYMENNWFWTADHDIDDPNFTQITVYTGRGLLVESAAGTIWMIGTAVEHHDLYQYFFHGTKNIVAGQIQTETAYYQPNPNARVQIFPINATYHDPIFPATKFTDNGHTIPNADGWGLLVEKTNPLLVYGAGHYSFFDNYSTTCSNQGNGEICQSRIVGISSSTVYLYDLHTVGTNRMITLNGQDIAYFNDNLAGFTDEIMVFRT